MKKLIFSFVFFASSFALAAPKGVVILVPGTMNSVIPGAIEELESREWFKQDPYFGRNVHQALHEKGFEVFVIRGLSPMGDLAKNGARVLEQTRELYLKKYPAKDVPLHFLAHSAGGLYLTTVFRELMDLPIGKALFISTPLSGSRLADFFFGKGGIPKFVTDYSPIDLRGLRELRTDLMREFWKTYKIPDGVELLITGGRQTRPISASFSLDSRFLLPILGFTDNIINEDSDGIIENSSYMNPKVEPTTFTGRKAKIRILTDIFCELDHPEQALDVEVLKYFGSTKLKFVDERQKAYYTALAELF